MSHDAILQDIQSTLEVIPTTLYPEMGRFGHIVTAPLWIAAFPAQYRGPMHKQVQSFGFPLLLIFLLFTPVIIGVIIFERVVLCIGWITGTPIKWVEKEGLAP